MNKTIMPVASNWRSTWSGAGKNCQPVRFGSPVDHVPSVRVTASRNRIRHWLIPGLSCVLAFGMLTHAVHASTPSVTKTGWSICKPFEDAADAKNEIPMAVYDKIMSSLQQPAKTPVEPEFAAPVLLHATMVNSIEKAQWQWRNIKNTVDKVYDKKIRAYKMVVDINNDGPSEAVIQYLPSSSAYYNPFSYVLDEKGRLDRNFFGANGKLPALLFGIVVVLNGKTYLINASTRGVRSDRRPAKQLLEIYMPSRSPMRDKGGINPQGTGPLCAFTIIN